jgi:hypothetical protein
LIDADTIEGKYDLSIISRAESRAKRATGDGGFSCQRGVWVESYERNLAVED